MRKHRVVMLAVGVLSIVVLVVGIAAAAWRVPSTRAADTDPSASERIATVMTRNLDDGTDYGSLGSATSVSQFIAAATADWQEVQASNPPERAAAVAHEIAVARPDFVGIQEAPLWRTGPLFSPHAPSATTVVYDVTQSLLDGLTVQGAPYMVVATTTNLDFEVPTALGYDVRYTDRTVLLARSDLPTSQLKLSNVQAQQFATNLTIQSVVGPLTIPESWIAVDATVRGKTYRVVTTHLQSGAPPIQLAQASELLQGPANTPLPVVLACDCNSDAANSVDPTYATYASLIAAGFVDAWSAAHPSDPGYTWPLHLEDPVGPSTPFQRVDLVLARGVAGVVAAEQVGGEPSDLTPTGLWPSDHVGVVAQLQIPLSPADQ